jgi:hypothetical protein
MNVAIIFLIINNYKDINALERTTADMWGRILSFTYLVVQNYTNYLLNLYTAMR